MTDNSTIIIYRAKDGYRFRLISPENKKIVGSAVMSFKYKQMLTNQLLVLREFKCPAIIYQDKSKQYRFRLFSPFGNRILVKSEAYTQKHNAEAGLESCRRAMEIGLVSCIACENSDVIPLADIPQAAIERNWFNEE